jgi:epoxyqueuosine reductase QueG
MKRGEIMLTSEMIKEYALDLGANDCGIASADRFEDAPDGFRPTDIYSECKSVVVILKKMPIGAILAENPIPYTHAAYKIYEQIDRIVMDIMVFCESKRVNSAIVPSDVPYLYWDGANAEGKGILSLKHAAVNAGLGIMGKNTIFIHPEYGNMVYIGALLVAAELKEDPINVKLSCPADCRICIDACRNNAIEEGHVNQKLCRELSFFKTGRGWDLYNCCDCRSKCPMSLSK